YPNGNSKWALRSGYAGCGGSQTLVIARRQTAGSISANGDPELEIASSPSNHGYVAELAMPLTDQIKNYATKLVEKRPDQTQLGAMVRRRRPTAISFRDDGIVPNHPHWPLIVYRQAIAFDSRFDADVTIDALFD